MNILITGGAGFIGSELAKFLIKKGHNIKILDNLEYGYRDNFEGEEGLIKNFICDDIRSKNIIDHLNGIDIVFHFAGISSLPECESNPSKAFEVNTTAVANLLSACRTIKVKKIIFASTSAVYENNDASVSFSESDVVNPNLIYATTKYCAEQICRSYAQNYKMDITICRFFNVFGPHQDCKRKSPPFTSYLIPEALADRVPTIFNTTDVKRDYIFIEDLMQYLFLIMSSPKRYFAEIFNLASGKGYSALEISRSLYATLGKRFEYIEGDPNNFWDNYEGLFNLEYNLSKERIKKEVFKNCIGNSFKVSNEFGYTAKYDLETGLNQVVNYQKSQNDK